MTRDEVIRMAREAGWKDLREFDSEMRDDIFMGKTQDLERFAALVAAAEREACIGLVTDNDLSNAFGSRVDYRQQLCAAIRARKP